MVSLDLRSLGLWAAFGTKIWFRVLFGWIDYANISNHRHPPYLLSGILAHATVYLKSALKVRYTFRIASKWARVSL